MEIEKEIVREDARVLKNWRKINCWAQIITRRSRYGFWWFVLNNWFCFNFLTPAHPHAQTLFLFPIVFGINKKTAVSALAFYRPHAYPDIPAPHSEISWHRSPKCHKIFWHEHLLARGSVFQESKSCKSQPSPKHSRPPLIMQWLNLWHGPHRLPLRRGSTFEANGGLPLLSVLVLRRKRVDQERTLKRCNGASEKQEGCRNSHLKSAPGTDHCRTNYRAQTTRTFFYVEEIHAHWQATPDQFYSQFNMPMFIS